MYTCKFKKIGAILLALSLFVLLAFPCFADGKSKVRNGIDRAGDMAGGVLDDAGDMLEDAGDKVEDATDKDHKDDEANDGNNAEDGVTDDGATGDKDGVIGDENAEDHKKPENDGESGAMDDDMDSRNGTIWAIIIGLIIAAIVVLLIVLLMPSKSDTNMSGKNR